MNDRDSKIISSTIEYLAEKGRDRDFLNIYATKLMDGEDVNAEYVSLMLLEVFDTKP